MNHDGLPGLFETVALERRLAELTILYEVSRALQKTVDEESALHIILVGVTAGRGLGFNRAFILLVDEEEKLLRGRLAIGPESPEEASVIWRDLENEQATLGELLESLTTRSFKRDTWVNELVGRIAIPLADDINPLVRILRSREAGRTVGGIFQPHGFAVGDDLHKILGAEEFAVAPLFLAEKELGILIADNSITRAAIEIPSLRLLQIFAQEASAAIQNTRLYKRLKEEVRLSERRNLNLRESQRHLLQAERLSTIGRMATLLAHEIRTPLVSIGGFARRLVRATPPQDPRREELEIIVSEVTRLERLVLEVLGYSKISNPEYKATNINALIRSVVTTMQDEIQKNSVRTELKLDPELPDATLDEVQVRQALMNLVVNALEAMPSGGVLTITTTADGEFLEIGVSDTGLGIPAEHWKKLFTPFFTTKTSGTGLGLAIVSQVIDNHRGSLRFNSVPGKGTTFHLRLMFRPNKDRATGASSPSSQQPRIS